MSMTVSDYISADSVEKAFTRVQTAWKTSKDSGFALFKTSLGDAFNAGFFAMMNFKKGKTPSVEDASTKLTNDYLPASFGKNEMCKVAIDSVIDRIKVNSKNNVLNVGYEKTLREPLREIMKTIYAIGLTSGFEIANDPELKE